MGPFLELLRFTYLPLTPILIGTYLVALALLAPLPDEARGAVIAAVAAAFGLLPKTLALRSARLEIEPLLGPLLFGLLRRPIPYHDLLRIRFRRHPFPLGPFLDRIDLVTSRGSLRFHRIAGRRTWHLQREFLRRMPDKVSWYPSPPDHIDLRYDL